jgi:hypothetical protein
MKRLIRKSCVICLGVLVSFTLTVSGLQRYVICVGEDRHVAIEAVDSLCCSKDYSSQACSAGSAETVYTSEPGCGACVDVSLFVGFAAPAKESSHGSATLLVSVPPALAAVDGPYASEYRPVSEFSVPPPYFIPLRSIVLLI